MKVKIILMEVMYMGKACVVSNVDGNRDVIQNEKNGFVCAGKQEYREGKKQGVEYFYL